jgi:Ca-activated chloride channel homolog
MNDVYGLLSPASDPIPLVGVKVEGDILGRGARVVVYQLFRNIEKTPVEAVYKFPLPEGSAICGFTARVNGRAIQGQVEEREKAFELYDDALKEGDGAYLLDEERPNIFTLSVGNLNPGAEAVIEIEYITLLDIEGKKIRFTLSTAISPRYLPDEIDDDNGIPVDGKLHPPYAADVPYGLSIALRIHKGGFVDSIESPSHQVKVENLKGDPINVSLSAESVRMDRDFILYMAYVDSLVSRAYQYHTGNESFVQLDFLPEKDLLNEKTGDKSASEGLKREIIFVIDCSGSMEGDSIQEAKKAVEVCLRGLDQGKLFNIYRFGSTHESFYPKSVSYNEKTANEALDYLKSIDADLGGTEILGPLKVICSSRGKERDLPKDIILLTDGEVGNESEIFKLIKNNNREIRVFPVGIGAGCNEYFIKGLARAGGGASDFIFPGERIEPKVLGLFGKIGQEMVTDLSISWGTSAAEQSPGMPVAFMGTPTSVFARIPGASIGKTNLKLKGKVGGRENSWDIEVVNLGEVDFPIPTLWARERIRDLEESGDALLKGSRQKERKKDQVKEKIIEISKGFGVLSQSTSFVAVEERDEKDKTEGEVTLRKVPVLLTVGWHGAGRLHAPGMVYSRDTRTMACMDAVEISADLGPMPSVSDPDGFLSRSRVIQRKESIRDKKLDLLLHILSLQRPEGGMMLHPGIAGALGIDFDEIQRAAGKITVRIPILSEWRREIDPVLLLSTAILIQALESNFMDHRDKWERVVGKSRSWLEEIFQRLRPKINGDELMRFANRFAGHIRVPGA